MVQDTQSKTATGSGPRYVSTPASAPSRKIKRERHGIAARRSFLVLNLSTGANRPVRHPRRSPPHHAKRDFTRIWRSDRRAA